MGNLYEVKITNNHLNTVKIIKGSTPVELKVKQEIQLDKWSRLADISEEREGIIDLKELAEYDTAQTEKFLKRCRDLLISNLGEKAGLDWANLYDDRPFPPFVFSEAKPRHEKIKKELGVPRENFLNELIFPSKKETRINLEREAKSTYEFQLRQYEENMEAARKADEKQRKEYLKKQKAHNQSIDNLQRDFEMGRPYAVESVTRMTLAAIDCPEQLQLEFEAHFDSKNKMIIIECVFPRPRDITRTKRLIYNRELQNVDAVDMEQSEFDRFYRSLLTQLALLSLYKTFQLISPRHLQAAGFNGMVKANDNGRDEEDNICILTIKALREDFTTLDLENTPPEKCFNILGGIRHEPLTRLIKVKPLAEPDKSQALQDEGSPGQDQNDAGQRLSYSPGDFKHIASELMENLLDQINENLQETLHPKKKDYH